MAEKSIDSYPTRETVNLDDYIPVGKYGTTFKISVRDFIANLQEGKLKDNFGAENAGKLLSIGSDGSVILIEPN